MKDLPPHPFIFADPDLAAQMQATPASIDTLFQAYLGRPAKEGAQSALKERRASVADVERELRGSEEYRRKARLLRDHDRSQYDGAMLYIAPARAVFCPIAKVANTSVKDWALRLVGDGRPEPGMSHYWLDSGQSRMQARHWAFAARDRVDHAPDWVSVALLRDPVDRLVSCYCDKFGRNRMQDSVLHHTRPVYAFFARGGDPDREMIERGLSFRQLCFYINATAREVQDSHWAAQWSYLQNRRWDRLFALEKIESFEYFMRDRLPEELRNIRLGLTNAAQKARGRSSHNLSDALPGEWMGARTPPYDAFLSDDIRGFIGDYYALDARLHAQALSES
ncbi:sulfotransferase family 2 domain-containing protein [Thioclava electrotropha]|uniref:Sulfotransferase family 2 domain-containing protein n=1 Tax=Thioclava electrotropha TaxID=1549850 RepID=A0ABX6YTI7_9RHOB|nr:sulfotransferase family 2 domain-containing protein [Thioclava electrotropha]QPZ91149.1 sulfotransferase family 2 domain-containing protein [Thioclava electrotropha]